MAFFKVDFIAFLQLHRPFSSDVRSHGLGASRLAPLAAPRRLPALGGREGPGTWPLAAHVDALPGLPHAAAQAAARAAGANRLGAARGVAALQLDGGVEVPRSLADKSIGAGMIRGTKLEQIINILSHSITYSIVRLRRGRFLTPLGSKTFGASLVTRQRRVQLCAHAIHLSLCEVGRRPGRLPAANTRRRLASKRSRAPRGQFSLGDLRFPTHVSHLDL